MEKGRTCRRRPPGARGTEGQTLFISFMAAILVAAQIYIVTLVTNQSYRRTDKVKAQLKAHFIAQSAFSRTCSRLVARPWAERWFREGPGVEEDVELEGGTYSSLVENVDDPERRLADVWIRARSENTQVLMYWRIQHTQDGFDLEPRIQLDFFTYLTAGEELPAPGAAGALRAEVERLLAERRRNEAAALEAAERIAGTRRLEEVIHELGIRPEGVPLDEVDQADRLEEAARAPGARTPTPPPPPDAPEPPELGSERARRLLEQHPFPGAISRGVIDALGQFGIDPTRPDTGFFQDTGVVTRHYEEMIGSSPETEFDRHHSAMVGFLDEMADQVDTRGGTPEQRATIQEASALIREVLILGAERMAHDRGLTPPDPATFTVPGDGGAQWNMETEIQQNTQLIGYLNWISRNGHGDGRVEVR